MYVGTYVGHADIGEVDGVSFPRGVPVEVTQEMHRRLKKLDDYEVDRIKADDAEELGVEIEEEDETVPDAEPHPVINDKDKEVSGG